MSRVESHRDLIVWQKGRELAVEAYRLAKLMPKAEEYRLTNQVLRAAASVPANIAEGHVRGTRNDYAQFVSIARESLADGNFSGSHQEGRTAAVRSCGAGAYALRRDQQNVDRSSLPP